MSITEFITESSSLASAPTAVRLERRVDPAPTQKSPDVPAWFDPKVDVTPRGLPPLATQRRLFPSVEVEMKAHGDAFDRIVGPQGPRAGAFAGHIALVIAWFFELRRAKAWTFYVNAQARAAWELLTGDLDQIRPVIDFAIKRDPSSLAPFEALADLMKARAKVAEKGALTRRDRRSGKPRKSKLGRLARVHDKQRALEAQAAREAALGAALEAELKAAGPVAGSAPR